MNVSTLYPKSTPKWFFSRNLWLGLAGLIAFIVLFCVFTVDETETAIRFRLGEIVQANYQPGLHMKFPLINNIRKYDARLQSLDTEPERFLTAEKKNVIVDSFVKWRIADVGRFYTAVGGDPARANLRLDQIIKDSLRSEFSKRELQEVVSGDREQIMDVLSSIARREAEQLGIRVVDVRIKRIDLPEDVNNSVFRRMRAERERVARDFRSRGAEAAERIRAEADRQSTVILAEAYRDAERLRGEGDAKAAEIYAHAYSQEPDFYAFYRSLNAYRNGFTGNNDVMVLRPDSQFFKYFNDLK
ncbi:MAG: protease modulator HflC [Gammaproteobacteria bacterium]|nr:protease modulator HflC [Gammaproteobacteria bacterium]MCP5459213.1 protease modulator HflC [Gammaproteobacteria bacterium]